MIKFETNVSLKDSFYSYNNLYNTINHYLYNKYSTKEYSYNHICIDNLLYNEYCHIVAKFKDFLIYDDDTEFLNEFCNKIDLKSKLKYIFEFYSTYIHIYPNYLVLPEKKFIYKNLRKKQNAINEINEMKIERENKIYHKNNKSFQNSYDKKMNPNYINININNNINNSVNSRNCFLYLNSNSNNKINKILELPIKSSNHLTERNHQKRNIKICLDKINNEHNNTNQNSQYSSISTMNYNEESKKSKASITEIINLLSSSDKSKTNNINNDSENKKKNNCNKFVYKLSNAKKNMNLFFRLGNTEYIKKAFKTNKTRQDTFKSEIGKISFFKNESKINNKKSYLKNYKQKDILNKIDKTNIIHKQTITCMENISKMLINKSKNTHKKIKPLRSIYNKNNNGNKILKEHHQYLTLKTLSNFRKNKLSDMKNNIRNNIKKLICQKKNKFKILNNCLISKNATINFENNNSIINKINDNCRMNTDYQPINTKSNLIKKNINYKLMRSIYKSGFSVEEQRSKTKTKKNKYLNNHIKIDSDSHLSTQVSLNKKYRHNSTYTENIIVKMKNSFLQKTKTSNLNQKNNKNVISFSKEYTNYLKKKNPNINNIISSYGVKSFSPYNQNKYSKYNSTKNNEKRDEGNSTLKKNKIISNFFESKDFCNLRINSIKNKKSKNSEVKKTISSNKYKDKNLVNKSISLFLKSFNKGHFHIRNNEINKINKINNYNFKINSKNNHCENIKKDNYFYEYISPDNKENNNFLNKTHKKNINSKSIYIVSEEIENKKGLINQMKIGKCKTKKNKHILNLLKNSKNRNFIQYKISSKVLGKSLKMNVVT